MNRYELFLDGRFVPAASGETYDSVNPATGEVVARVARAGREDARRAIHAARRAFDDGSWSDRAPEARRDALLAVADRLSERAGEIAALETADAGLTVRYSSLMVPVAVQQFRQLVEQGAKIPLTESLPHNEFPLPSLNLLAREPWGVATAIVPFNAPFLLTIWKLAPALIMGNTLVVKPSPYTPASAMEIARAFASSDVPPGVVNVLPGGGAEVGEELVASPLVDRVAFTGSTEVGRRIAQLAAATVKKVTLELGGKSANIVLDDADLDAAVPGALWAMFLHSGQTCQAGSRLLLHSSIHDAFIERLVDAVGRMRIGDPASPETDLGPLISPQHLEKAERYVAIGREEGCTVACGGERLTGGGLDRGNFFAPTILTGVRNEMRVAQEEIFGPVLSVIRFSEVEEAIALANDSIYGLSGAVWSRDVTRAMRVARCIKAGTLWVNDYHMIVSSMPFGGYKQSGIGKELGEAGLLEFVRSKALWVDQGRTHRKMWLPVLGLDRILDVTW